MLKKSESGRIVSLSSTAHTMGYLNLEDKDFHKNYYHWGPYYGHTKLAICLFVRELSKRLAGTGKLWLDEPILNSDGPDSILSFTMVENVGVNQQGSEIHEN